MLEQKIQNFIDKLSEQSKLGLSENTLIGLFSVMYGFIEIIEQDPVFSKFIRTKINEELDIKKGIANLFENKEISKEEEYALVRAHVSNKFWNEYYCLFKAAHDCIKIDRCKALSIKPNNIMWGNIIFFNIHDPKFLKRLTKDEWQFHFDDFEKCIARIKELINSDQILLNKIYNEYLNKETNKNSDISFILNDRSEFGEFQYQEKSITFKGLRAHILNFFIQNDDGLNKTYKDFEQWLEAKNIRNININSNIFRLNVEKINERINKEYPLFSIIETVDKSENNPNEINRYKLKVYKKER